VTDRGAGWSHDVSLYNPEGLRVLAAELLDLYHRGDTPAAAAKLAEMHAAIRDLMARERAAADTALTHADHRVAIGRETVIAMVLRSFPCLPDTTDLLRAGYARLAGALRAAGQPVAADAADDLARGAALRFDTDASCQIAVLPGLFERCFEAPGWFVEVGAFDGETFSNSAGLADRGWHGLYVEPHPLFVEYCRTRHGANPNLRIEHCAVGRAAGEGVISSDGVFSSVSSADAPSTGADDRVPIRIERLDTLLVRHAVPQGFDLLIVDVEGQEDAVFDGFDLDAWRPRMLIVELGAVGYLAPDSADPRLAIHRRLLGGGYTVLYWDTVNIVYWRSG
jgi:FkbM family methyltransferase